MLNQHFRNGRRLEGQKTLYNSMNEIVNSQTV